MENKKEISTTYAVSKKTELWFQCIRLNSYLYGKVSEAAAAYWGEEQEDEIMKRFSAKWSELEEELQRLAMEVISDNLFEEGNNVI